MNGIVSNIERGSTVDGPGIRTVVFLKGCPLKCVWCHNPENISSEPEVLRDLKKCRSCGHCVGLEPSAAEKECPVHAAESVGRILEVQEVMAAVLRDLIFIGQDGGITFSGGEPLMQSAWVAECAACCCRYGIHTALDTTLFAAWEKIVPLLSCISLFMVDLKHTDSQKHFEYTGVHNEGILANLRRLDRMNKALWLRTPLIPGYNTSSETVEKMLKIASGLKNLQRYEFLQYNPLTSLKYRRLGRDFRLRENVFENRGEIARLIEASGLPVFMNERRDDD